MNAVYVSLLIVHGEHCVVVEQLDIDHICVEEGLHKATVFLPVDHVGVQIHAKSADQICDVVLGELGIPSVVHVYGERP